MRSAMAVMLVLASFLALSPAASAQSLPLAPSRLESLVSSTGSFSIVPVASWGSGDFNALSDRWAGYETPRVDQMSIAMDATASTTYEGDLFFKKLKLKVGLMVDVDDNFIGKLDRFMGYVNWDGFTLRVQTSTLRGEALWTGAAVPGMPSRSEFDNPFASVDLLYYRRTGGIDYWGIGYTSYRLPVQLDCLTFDEARREVWWAPVSALYQPDMAFRVYSVLFGLDTLYEAFARSGTFASMQGAGLWLATQDRAGAGLWLATQDRAGAGLAYISDEARSWIEAVNGLPLWSATQIAMLVDYNLVLGVQYVRDLGRVRMGLGLGFELGGQMVLCVTPKGPVDSSHVDASPAFYLFHYGPILKATIAF